jgi:hypothetical protein
VKICKPCAIFRKKVQGEQDAEDADEADEGETDNGTNQGGKQQGGASSSARRTQPAVLSYDSDELE